MQVEHYEKSGIKEVLYEDNRQPGANKQSGGLAVVNLTAQGTWVPEFISDGFASLCGMTPEEMRELYKHDAMAGVHPEDRLRLAKELQEYAQTQNECGEFIYRLLRADGSYFWVRNYISSVKRDDGLYSNFCSVRDITAEVQEKLALRQQFHRMFNSYYNCVGKNELLLAAAMLQRICFWMRTMTVIVTLKPSWAMSMMILLISSASLLLMRASARSLCKLPRLRPCSRPLSVAKES